ncbi:MAG: TrkA C-terminal domain-containing protein, partial [Alphaproteobacteria bacterium]
MPIHAMSHFLEAHPDLAVFLVVGLGYLVGKLKYRGFGPGPVTGALFAGLLVGQFAEVPVSDTAKSILFLLFLFGIGYSVGPKFLSAVRGDGLPGVAIGIVVPLAAIATAVVVARVLGLDPGFAAGMFSGSTTESPAIGTAAEAIRALPIPQDRKSLLVGHIAVADALCYLFGALGVILMTTLVGPWILGIDVREEARRLEEKYGLAKAGGTGSAWRAVELRAYEIPADGRIAGMGVREAEAMLDGHRAFILRLRRDGAVLDATPETILRAGDVVAVTARRAALVEAIGPTAREVEDRELLDVATLALDVYVSAPNVVGRTLAELGAREGTRGVFVSRIQRSGLDIPVGPQAALERGDVATLVGPAPAVEAAAARAGAATRASDPTDFVTLGLAIFLGGLMGTLVAIDIGAAHVSLSVSVGTLVAGLFVGWLR